MNVYFFQNFATLKAQVVRPWRRQIRLELLSCYLLGHTVVHSKQSALLLKVSNKGSNALTILYLLQEYVVRLDILKDHSDIMRFAFSLTRVSSVMYLYRQKDNINLMKVKVNLMKSQLLEYLDIWLL